MKRNIRIFAILLVICMFMTSINVYALDTNKVVEEERIFTKAELACMTDGSLGTATGLSEEFIEVKNIEGKTTRASTTYYIIEMADGYMLTSPTSGTFSRTRYANSASNNVRKWIFTEDSDGDYIVYSYTDSTKCLTINPSTKAVTLSTYTGSEYQKWRIYISSNGNTLRSTATDSSVSGYKLVISGSSCYVSNTTYTPVGFFDVSWYTPVSTLSHSNFYLALEQNKKVTPTKSPSDAICSNNWINWSSSNTSKFTVNDTGYVTGVSAGTATLTFTDKITRKYGTCTITVMPIANGTYLLQNKQNSDYAKVKDGTMTNGQNVVQYDLGEGNEFRWIFTLDTTTGYFSIKSANSGSTNYYMAVSDDSSALDKPIVIRSATETTLTEGMKWKVETTANGAYKIIPKTGEATNYVLATSVSTGTNNKNLLQGDYIDNNSYRDEWFLLMPLTYDARIFYDSGSTLSASAITEVYNSAVVDIYSTYYIDFNLTSTSLSSQLNGASCPNSSVSDICTISCGANSTCGTAHHKSSLRLLNTLQSDSYYTYRLVSHAICYYDDGDHSEVVGLGHRPGMNSITSMESTPNLVRSIQHELTHNLGGSHNTCISSQKCVLNGDFGYWCDNCYTAILEERG